MYFCTSIRDTTTESRYGEEAPRSHVVGSFSIGLKSVDSSVENNPESYLAEEGRPAMILPECEADPGHLTETTPISERIKGIPGIAFAGIVCVSYVLAQDLVRVHLIL